MPIIATLDTAPKTIPRRSIGTALDISVFAIGVIKPIKNPAIARNIPRPHMLGIKYCKINRDPTAHVAVKIIRGIVNRCVTLLIEMDANALNKPAPKIMMPTIVATNSSFTDI